MEDHKLDGRVILKFIKNELDWRVWAGFIWHVVWTSDGMW
jgi:hypothetical protein